MRTLSEFSPLPHYPTPTLPWIQSQYGFCPHLVTEAALVRNIHGLHFARSGVSSHSLSHLTYQQHLKQVLTLTFLLLGHSFSSLLLPASAPLLNLSCLLLPTFPICIYGGVSSNTWLLSVLCTVISLGFSSVLMWKFLQTWWLVNSYLQSRHLYISGLCLSVPLSSLLRCSFEHNSNVGVCNGTPDFFTFLIPQACCPHNLLYLSKCLLLYYVQNPSNCSGRPSWSSLSLLSPSCAPMNPPSNTILRIQTCFYHVCC